MLRNDKNGMGEGFSIFKNAENKAPLLCLCVMALMLASGILMPLLFPDLSSVSVLTAVYFISFLLPAAVFAVVLRKNNVYNFSAPSRGTFKFTLSSTLLLVCAAILTKCIISYVTGGSASQASALLSDAGLFESLLCYTLLPAVLEELVFRGIAFSVYQRTCGGLGAILATSLFFAMSHFSVEEFLLYFVSGIILGTVVYITRSVYPAIILHLINNTVSYFLENAVFKIASESKSGVLAIFLVTAVTLVVLFWFLLELEGVCKKRYLISPDDEEYAKSDIHELTPTLLPHDGDIVTALLRMALSPVFLCSIVLFAVFAIVA